MAVDIQLPRSAKAPATGRRRLGGRNPRTALRSYVIDAPARRASSIMQIQVHLRGESRGGLVDPPPRARGDLNRLINTCYSSQNGHLASLSYVVCHCYYRARFPRRQRTYEPSIWFVPAQAVARKYFI
jgi:hypothetical protein